MEETTDELHVTRGVGDFRQVEDIQLAEGEQPEEVLGEKVFVRKVARPTLVNNHQDSSHPVKITILHQRRKSKNVEWKDAEPFTTSEVKAGQEISLTLDCQETFALYKNLDRLHKSVGQGLPQEGSVIRSVNPENEIVVKGEAKTILETLLSQEGEDVWKVLEQLKPGLLETVYLQQQHKQRTAAVEKFRKNLTNEKCQEKHWKKFFEDNPWIFGHGLDYRILHEVQSQPNYGGVMYDGRGAPRGDNLMATVAETSFTVLVEIKTPLALLVKDNLYRNMAHELGEDLVGGVSQLQAQCGQWNESGARDPRNIERLNEERVYTHEPKGILVVGNTAQLNTIDKRSTFERYRRNLHKPEILTFDELLGRAEFLVQRPNMEESEASREDSQPSVSHATESE